MRVVFLLRSTEIKPLFYRFVENDFSLLNDFSLSYTFHTAGVVAAGRRSQGGDGTAGVVARSHTLAGKAGGHCWGCDGGEREGGRGRERLTGAAPPAYIERNKRNKRSVFTTSIKTITAGVVRSPTSLLGLYFQYESATAGVVTAWRESHSSLESPLSTAVPLC